MSADDVWLETILVRSQQSRSPVRTAHGDRWSILYERMKSAAANPEGYLALLSHSPLEELKRQPFPETTVPSDQFVYSVSPLAKPNYRLVDRGNVRAWEGLEFPSCIPSRRLEVFFLANCLDEMFTAASTEEEEFNVLSTGLKEISRQVRVSCLERAVVLDKLLERSFSSRDKIFKEVKKLRTIISKTEDENEKLKKEVEDMKISIQQERAAFSSSLAKRIQQIGVLKKELTNATEDVNAARKESRNMKARNVVSRILWRGSNRRSYSTLKKSVSGVNRARNKFHGKQTSFVKDQDEEKEEVNLDKLSVELPGSQEGPYVEEDGDGIEWEVDTTPVNAYDRSTPDFNEEEEEEEEEEYDELQEDVRKYYDKKMQTDADMFDEYVQQCLHPPEVDLDSEAAVRAALRIQRSWRNKKGKLPCNRRLQRIFRSRDARTKEPVSPSWLSRFVSAVYRDKIEADRVDDRVDHRRATMSEFLLEYLREIYGTSRLVDSYAGRIMTTCSRLAKKDMRIQIFWKFISEEYSSKQLDLFLDAWDALDDQVVTKIGPKTKFPMDDNVVASFVPISRCAMSLNVTGIKTSLQKTIITKCKSVCRLIKPTDIIDSEDLPARYKPEALPKTMEQAEADYLLIRRSQFTEIYMIEVSSSDETSES